MSKTLIAAGSVLMISLAVAAVRGMVTDASRPAPAPATAAGGPVAPAVQAVEGAFTAAMAVEQHLGVSPRAAAFFAQRGAGAIPPMPTTTDLRAVQEADTNRIGEHFADPQVAKERTYLANAIRAQADPTFRFLGAGIGRVTFASVQVNGDRAVVKATVPVWSEVAQIRPTDGKFLPVRPQSVLAATAALVRAGSTWKVVRLDWTFVPGTGP